MHLLYFLFLFLSACSNSERPAPYNELKEVLPYDRHGWYSNGKELKQLISDNRVRTVVEVGCWLGKSTRHIAKQLPRNGKIYAVIIGKVLLSISRAPVFTGKGWISSISNSYLTSFMPS